MVGPRLLETSAVTPSLSTSEWIQVKSKSSKIRKSRGAASCSIQTEGDLCVDIGLDLLQVEQKAADEKSISSDSSDVRSVEDGVDPDIDEAQFLKVFSQRQQKSARGKGPKSI